MKTKLVILAAAFVLNHSALAQTSTTAITTSPASAEATKENTSTATDNTAAVQNATIRPAVKYTGIMRGPGLDFSGARQTDGNGDAFLQEHARDLNAESRVKLLVQSGPNFEGGLEARVNTLFGAGNKAKITTGNWRLLGNFKHVYKDDLINLALIPRLMLPTSNKMRNRKLTVSPDMIADLGITPKNSRFSFDAGTEYIHFLYTEGSSGADYTKAVTAELDPWLEVDYQLTPKSQLMISYWPTLDAFARQGRPLATASNEIDVGGNYEFAKGWTVNPFVAIETNDLNAHAIGMDKNMQLNLIVSGAIL